MIEEEFKKMNIKKSVFKATLILSAFCASAPIFVGCVSTTANSNDTRIQKADESDKSKISIGKYKFTDDAFSQIKLPKKYNKNVLIKDENSDLISVKLPSINNIDQNPHVKDNSENFRADNEQISLNNTKQGFQSSIKINNDRAYKYYSYKFNLPSGYKIETARQYLGKNFDTGEVYIVDNNIVKYIINKPWAKDASGKKINTNFVVHGNTVTQKVDFDKNSIFPIIADPSFWQITKCVGSISWAIGSAFLSEAKILKLKKYMKELGGMGEAAELMLKASTTEERLRVGGTALLHFAAVIGGIDGIMENCS